MSSGIPDMGCNNLTWQQIVAIDEHNVTSIAGTQSVVQSARMPRAVFTSIADKDTDHLRGASRMNGVWPGVESAPLGEFVEVLFQVLHAFDGDDQHGTIGSRDEFLLGEVPNRELQVFTRSTRQPLEIQQCQPWALQLRSPASVEQFQHDQSDELFGLELSVSLRVAGHQTPPLLPESCVYDVVLGPFLSVAQNPIRLDNHPETILVSAFTVVRMKALGQHAIHPVNRLGFRVWAYLQDFVIVVGFIHNQTYRMFSLAPEPFEQARELRRFSLLWRRHESKS